MRTGFQVLDDDAQGLPAAGFEVAYVDPSGSELRCSLLDAWSVRFEQARSARAIHSYKGQRNLPGLWWSATTGRHVGYESHLERDHVMLLDFDPQVVGIASQPFWLFWTGMDRRSLSHAPDYFARRADGSAIVMDCRPVGRRKPRDEAKFAATHAACGLLGWEFRLGDAADEVLLRNVRWLAGYRHPRHRLEAIAARLLDAFEPARALLDGATTVGDPIVVLPVLFHLLWTGELRADLSSPLATEVLVSHGEAR